MESQFGANSVEVLTIKEQYTLFQIKDYLLVQKLSERCDQEVFTVLYFHSGNCKDCFEQSLVLDEIREQYPGIRVYWLDKDLDTPAMQTLLSMFTVTVAPTLIVDGEKVHGYASLEELTDLVPDWVLSREELEELEAQRLEETQKIETEKAEIESEN